MNDAARVAEVLNLPTARCFQLHRWPDRDADRGGIIELEPADLRRLMDGAALKFDDLDPSTDTTELLDGPYLVVDFDPLLDDDDYCDPWVETGELEPETVRQLIQSIYLGHCRNNGALQLVSQASLSTLLPEYRAAHPWIRGGDSVYVPDPTYSLIESSTDYYGRCEICTCGMAGCAANFCWKQDDEIMLFLDTGGSDLVVAHLFPCLQHGSRMGPPWPPG